MGTEFTQIYERFLALIDDPDMALMSTEDIMYHLNIYLEDAIFTYLMPVPSCLKEVTEDGFESQIPIELQNIIARGMVVSWLNSKIKKERTLRSAIANRDYSELSNANQLKALIDLQDTELTRLEKAKRDFDYTDINFDGFK